MNLLYRHLYNLILHVLLAHMGKKIAYNDDQVGYTP